MQHNTVFDILSIDRNDIKWEDYLYHLTPVEKVGDIYFKREDYFAPLGYDGINGSKLRQCIWLIDEYVKNDNSAIGILSGTSVKSPQLPMGSAVASHYGLDSCHVIGATKTNTAIKHSNVAMASWFGASWDIVPNIAYNPVLQRRVKKLLQTDKFKDWFYLEYGITLDHKVHSAKRITQFHMLGAHQVVNIPDHIETLIIPAGSCNSCTSILLGLSKLNHPNLKDVYLIGIGPNKIDFIEERLSIIQDYTGVETKPYSRYYYDNPKKQSFYENTFEKFWFSLTKAKFNLHHYDLHSTGYVDYQNEVYETYHNIEFHKTYEAKVWKYLKQNKPELINDKSMFWIIGSEPRKDVMYELLKDKLGLFPESIKQHATA